MTSLKASSREKIQSNFFFRILRLIFGLFLYSLAIALTVQANIGYMPWDVFSAGVAKQVGITLGMSSIVTGLVFVIIAVLLGEAIGLGTILNMILIGVFLDVILNLNIIPLMPTFISGILMMTFALFVVAQATYFYIGSGFGAGPRDSLMVSVSRITGLPIGLCRSLLEFLAAVLGWLFGGSLGIGTLFAAVVVGFAVQLVFSFYKFNPKEIKHEKLKESIKRLFN